MLASKKIGKSESRRFYSIETGKGYEISTKYLGEIKPGFARRACHSAECTITAEPVGYDARASPAYIHATSNSDLSRAWLLQEPAD